MIDFTGLVDIKIVIVLLIIGALVKHLKFMAKVMNKAIPPILIAIGVGMSIYLSEAITLTSVLIGVVSASLAVGIHSSGKNIWQLISGSLTNSTYMANANTLSNGATSQEKMNVQAGTSKGINIKTSSLWGEVEPGSGIIDNNIDSSIEYEDSTGGTYLDGMEESYYDLDDEEEIIYDIDENAVG